MPGCGGQGRLATVTRESVAAWLLAGRPGHTGTVTGDWRITENSPRVAAQFADRWATAAAAQARRIKDPYNTLERVPDDFLQVTVLHHVLRAAEPLRPGRVAETGLMAVGIGQR